MAQFKTYRNLDLGTTGQIVKATPGALLGWYIANQATSARYVKVYDKATAPTESDTPVMTLVIPASAGANAYYSAGWGFDAGISLRATTAIADNSTAAPSSNDVVVNLIYV